MSLDFTKPYCLVHKDGKVFYASGPVTRSWLLADVPRPTGAHPVISMVPYPQVRERGYVTHDNNEPVISLVPEVYRPVELTDVVALDPPVPLRTRADLVEFLTDPKEINELFQVVDEELKMMSRICGKGGVVRGPYLREMSSLVHTEYVLDGSATMDPIEAFRESMYAATMIGSPLEKAARVIHRH